MAAPRVELDGLGLRRAIVPAERGELGLRGGGLGRRVVVELGGLCVGLRVQLEDLGEGEEVDQGDGLLVGQGLAQARAVDPCALGERWDGEAALAHHAADEL